MSSKARWFGLTGEPGPGVFHRFAHSSFFGLSEMNLTMPCVQEYLLAIPLLYGARRNRLCGVDSGMRWPPRCRTLGMLSGAFLLIAEEGTDAGNTGGRSKCVSGRQFARTGSNGGSGASWDMQQAAKSIRVRNAGVCAASEAALFTVCFGTRGHVFTHVAPRAR